MKLKTAFALLLALTLALTGAVSLAEGTEAPVSYQLGDQIADFSFTTFDGKTYTLSETLKEKDMVLINLWATWCGPCQAEFPYMTEAYEQYKDRVEIFALSVEEEDTDEILADYVGQVGMTFPVGRDTAGLNSAFYTGYIPTTVVIDRFGKVAFFDYGSQTSSGAFTRLFDEFVGDGYTETRLLEAIPPQKPTVEAADAAALAEALNAEGANLTFANPEDVYTWPLALVSEDGRSYAVSTNMGVGESLSCVSFDVTAAEGDAIAFDYKVSSEAGFDFLTVQLGGEIVKVFSGESDWASAVVPFPAAGAYTVTLGYLKDQASDEGNDQAAFDNVKILSGEEAAAAVAALPVYPVAEAVTLTPAGSDAREIVFNDPTGTLAAAFGDVPYYIVPDDQSDFTATLTAGLDPNGAHVEGSSGEFYILADCLHDGVYAFVAHPGESYNYVSLYPIPGSADSVDVFYFASEEAVNAFVTRNFTEEEGVSWSYKDGSPAQAGDLPAGDADYVLTFADQNGNPVAGVIANICDENTCTPMTSDEAGKIAFTLPGYAYHVQVLKVPDGYAFDTTQEFYLDAQGGEMSFTLTAADASAAASLSPTIDALTVAADLPAGYGAAAVCALHDLPVNVAVQQIAFARVEGEEYLFVTQRSDANGYLSRLKLDADGQSATVVDSAVLTGWGHCESLDVSVHNGETYLFITGDANMNEDHYWGTTVIRCRYNKGEIEDVRRITGIECATGTGEPVQSDATPYRINFGLDDEADRIAFFCKSDRNNTTKNLVNYLALYRLSDLQAALDASETVSLADCADAYLGSSGNVELAAICPSGSFQGVEITPAGEILVSGGTTSKHPSVATLALEDGAVVLKEENRFQWIDSHFLGRQDWSTGATFVEVESVKCYDGQIYVVFNPGGGLRQNGTEIYRIVEN